MDLLLATNCQLTLCHIEGHAWQSVAAVTPWSSADNVSELQIAPDAEYALALSESGRHLVQVPMSSLADQLSHRPFPVSGQHSCFALSQTGPGTRCLAAGSLSGVLTLYDAPEGHCRRSYPTMSSPINCLALEAEDALCLIGFQSGDVVAVNTATGFRHPPMGLRPGDRSPCECLATSRFLPGLVAAGYRAGTLVLWDTGLGSSRAVVNVCGASDGLTGATPALATPIRAVRFSPVNASLLCVATADASLALYDVGAGSAVTEVGRIPLPDAPTRGLAFSPDGRQAVVGTRSAGCLVYDLRMMRCPSVHICCTEWPTGATVRDLQVLTTSHWYIAEEKKQQQQIHHVQERAVTYSPAANSSRHLLGDITNSGGGGTGSYGHRNSLDRLLLAPLVLTPPPGTSTLGLQQTPASQTKRVTFAESTVATPATGGIRVSDVACQTTEYCHEEVDSQLEDRLRRLVREEVHAETLELRRQLGDLRFLLVRQLDITEANLEQAMRSAAAEAAATALAAVMDITGEPAAAGCFGGCRRALPKL